TGTFTSDGTIETIGASTKLVLDHDVLTNKIGLTNGIVLVDTGTFLDLSGSTIDQGTATVHGHLEAIGGITSTLSNLAGGTGTGTFTSDGTIETIGASTKLVLDHD